MRHRVAMVALAIISTLSTSPANASTTRWWDFGHAHITEGAVSHLPDPLRAFFQANVEDLRTYSGWEPPGKHYIDIDYYPEFFAGTFPRNLNDLIGLYGSEIVFQNGTAPWTVGDYVDSLTTLMAGAGTEQEWADLLQTTGALAHYIEDLHNPLHLTLNYNGQLSGNDGIHFRYEGHMIQRHLGDLPITPSPGDCAYLPSVTDTVFDSIDVNYWYVTDILAADTAAAGTPPVYDDAYYDALWADTGGFTPGLYQDASEMVASAWYTAWVDAGSPTPIPEPAGLSLLVLGSLLVMRRARRTSPGWCSP